MYYPVIQRTIINCIIVINIHSFVHNCDITFFFVVVTSRVAI